MEGTSEDPLVKDQSNDTPDIAKDGVIENGVNGLCENDDQQMEVIDDDNEDEDDEHNKMETSDVADDISKEAANDNVEEAEEDEDETEVVEAEEGLEQHNNDNDDDEEEEVERLDDDDIEADDAPDNTSVAMTSQNDDDNEKDDEEEEEEEEDGASDENNVLCAVTNDKDYDNEYEENPLQVDTGDDEMMEVDSHDNTSDIECLDDNVLQDRTNVKITKVSTDETPTTTSNNNNDLNESIEIISSIDNNSDLKICEENGGGSGSGGSSIGSPDIEEIIDNKSNGHTPDEKSPKESKQKKSRKQIDLSNITPRRSSRNIKRTSYTEKEPEEVIDDNSDIEEIKPEDPLAVVDSKDKENTKLLLKSPIKINNNNKTTIVVNDTKRLVEIAAGSKSSKGGGKKEPTLVIIDTNSILSGRGGIPVSSSSSSSNNSINNKLSSHSHSVSSTSSFSVMPVNLSGTTMYSNMRTTITPVPMTAKSIHQMTSKLGSSITAVPMTSSSSSSSQLPITISSTSITPSSSSAHHQHQQRQFQQQQRHHEQQQRHHEQQQRHHDQQQRHHEQQQQQHEQQQQILPTLTDDMFVVEAPSFIVPYVYEKPPVIPLKEYVTKLDKCIEERERLDREKKREAKKAKKESGGGGDGKKDDANNHHDDSSDSDDDDEDDDDVIVDNSSNNNNVNKTNNDDNNSTTTTNDNKSINDDKSSINDEKIKTYFDLPLGKFFMQIGVNLVQEFVQTDLLRTQKRKQSRGGGQASAETQIAINSLIKNLEFSKENNEPFRLEMKKCEFCNFKTESLLVMQHHLETPHMKNYLYKCNFCPLEVRSPHDIRFHMEAEHNTRSRLEKGPAFHQCPNCPFEDNQKGKLTRHILLCAKKYRPEKNLEPSSDWEPPAKIPRLNRARNSGGGPLNTNALAMAMSAKGQQPLLPKLLPAPSAGRGRGRPPMQPRFSDMKGLRPGGGGGGGGGGSGRQDNSMPGMMYRPTSSGLLVPTSYQFGSNQLFSNTTVSSKSNPTAKLLSQPSISITPLPRTTSQTPVSGSGSSSKTGGKNTFVICEICDGYIKDLEQLRNHMQWIHKVKIHPKMIYNRPPLNCQKCQFRFFTDQGLERHLLGSHGLVTSSMQEAANKGKDAGRCPACGKVYQWKLLNHVARDHLMTLKPAHLSYKCTVCTATFGMYKQFESHVYSAHSAQSKQYKKNSSPASPSPRSSDSLLKPLKINDEITIIPQPAKPTTRSGGGSQGRNK